MILLQRLVAHNFKQLQDIELRLPDSGAVLIEGHNEAGKSSLFEAVFFALFGKPLLAERDYAIEDLKRYGTDTMEVALDFSIAGRAFSIARTFGKAHRAKLLAPGENGDETISSLSEIRKRLSQEMRLSSDALLNTCFVEQKRLERLEDMKLDARRDAINELLNLKVLSDLETYFKISRESREEITRQNQRVTVARLDAELAILEHAATQAGYLFQAAQRRDAEKIVRELENKIGEAQRAQGEIGVERANLALALGQSTQVAARLNALDGELHWRLRSWHEAENARAQSEQNFQELQERMSTLPAREAKLREQKQLAHSLETLENRALELEATHTFWPQLQAARSRAANAREQITNVARQPQNAPLQALLNLPAIAIAVVIAILGFALHQPIAGIFAALVAFAIIALLAARQAQEKATRDSKLEKQHEISHSEGELQALENQRPAILRGKSEAEIEGLLQEYSALDQSIQDKRQLLSAQELPTQSGALQARLAVLESELERERVAVARLGDLQIETESARRELENARAEFQNAWRKIFKNRDAPDTMQEAARGLDEARAELARAAEGFADEQSGARDRELQAEYSALDRQIAAWQHQCETQLQLLQSLPAVSEMQSDERDNTKQQSVEEWVQVLAARREEIVHHRAQRRAVAAPLEIGEKGLDLQKEEQELLRLENDALIKRRAGEIVAKTRGDIVSRVMPLTLANVRRVLPLLTQGRYRDVQWDEETNVLAIYDALAQEFVRKRVFSGGARDQISLALRLAFALATLPGEHNIRPGFLFLDEPLSSFDRARTQALVELLTRGLIRQSFQQIFLVSHSESFDPALFDFRLRMEGGRIAESTLP